MLRMQVISAYTRSQSKIGLLSAIPLKINTFKGKDISSLCSVITVGSGKRTS